MFHFLSKRPIATMAVIVLLMTITSFEYAPVSIMEARNFISAREMVTEGHWLLPTMNGEARYQKPPLPTWLAAISGSIFGLNNIFGMRLPGALMFLTIGIFTCLFSTKFFKSRSRGFIDALIMLTSFYVFGIIIEAPWDIFAHGFMLMAIYFLFQYFHFNGAHLRNAILATIFIVCSFLSKGPIAFYALLLPFIIAYVAVYRRHLSLKKTLSFVGIILVGIALGSLWFLYVRYQDPAIFGRVATKEAGNWGSYNVRPLYYYWNFFVQSGIWAVPAFISLLFPYLKSRVSNLKAYKFIMIWTVAAVILLSLIPEKKSRYLMPVLIPLALNIGFYFEYLIREFKNIKSKIELTPIFLYYSILSLICIILPVSLIYFKDRFTNLSLFWFLILCTLMVTMIIIIYYGLKNRKSESLFLVPVAIFVSVLFVMPPIYNTIKSNKYNPISNLPYMNEVENLEVYVMDNIAPEMVWQYGQKIEKIAGDSTNYHFPEDRKFALLVNNWDDEKEQILIKNNYSFRKITTFNMNKSDVNARDYKGRLINDLFLVEKN